MERWGCLFTESNQRHPLAKFLNVTFIYIYKCAPPPHTFMIGGGNGMFVSPPPTLLTPHFYFPLELYVYITLTNNYLAFFIYQLIIPNNLVDNFNNHISKYNSFILVLYRRYINYVSVCPPPPPPHTHTF